MGRNVPGPETLLSGIPVLRRACPLPSPAGFLASSSAPGGAEMVPLIEVVPHIPSRWSSCGMRLRKTRSAKS